MENSPKNENDGSIKITKHSPPQKSSSGEFNSHRKDLITLTYEKLEPCLPNFSISPEFTTIPTSLQPFVTQVENFFECKKLNSSIGTEIFAGFIHFFACMYCLPVIPQQLGTANYNVKSAYAIICLVNGLGSIASGFFTNTPLIIAPPTAVCIFLTSSLQTQNLEPLDGNLAVTMSGIAMFLIGILGPIGSTITLFIPECIQASTTVGIGLLTALAGAAEINLVIRGKYTLLEVGTITNEVIISFVSLAVLGMAITRHSRFAYIIAIAFGTIIWWIVENELPSHYTSFPSIQSDYLHSASNYTIGLIFSLIFLNILTLFGLARALCDLAAITPSDGSIPRGRLLILIIGLCNIISGLCYGPPIILSPESVGGIKAGAKTGLSTIICGILFLFSIFWGPFFTSIPAAGTSPVLIVIGLFLFLNIHRINFKEAKEGIPGFCCLFFISFTNSIICGLGIGYAMYATLHIFTGDLYYEIKDRIVMIRKRLAGRGENEDENDNEKGMRMRMRREENNSPDIFDKEHDNNNNGGNGNGSNGNGGDENENDNESVMNPVNQQKKRRTNKNETNESENDDDIVGRLSELPLFTKRTRSLSAPIILLPKDTLPSDEMKNMEEGNQTTDSTETGQGGEGEGHEGEGAAKGGGKKRKIVKRRSSFKEAVAFVKLMAEDMNVESGINTAVIRE